MYLTKEKKAEIFSEFGKEASNTGAAESQIALFSYRITHLTEHLKINKKDFSTKRALLGLVGKRRRLLDYLKKNEIVRYRAIIAELNLRK
ncbi:MAG: 30S ribosomal protein S15 [Salinivirgaceae bacterium]|nr:30S ribosomal protein S15 [Salinivirgaceae bacterium]MDD4747172.1 30S ribosomal protein S15 [Salinivirgaceae bacterium]MDY0280602.1 30S ribosomal protein S15 [Salinivirgaceae bacterium]